MDADRWRQVEALYYSALKQEPDDRDAYLTEACEGNVELRREVESLLRQNISSTGFLDRPPGKVPRSSSNRRLRASPHRE